MMPSEAEGAIRLANGMVTGAQVGAGGLESVTVRRRGIVYTLDLTRCQRALALREDTGEPPPAGAGAKRTRCAPPSGTGSAAVQLAFEGA
jgi:hypothetical protein